MNIPALTFHNKGIYTLNTWHGLWVQGEDAQTFLQGQLTCDVASLKENAACLGAHCNVKGRVLLTFFLCRVADRFLLLLPKEMVSHAQKVLAKYAVFSKVSLMPMSQDWQILCGVGSEGRKLSETYSDSPSVPVCEYAYPGEQTLIFVMGEGLASTKAHTHWMGVLMGLGIPMITTQTSALFTPHDLNYPALGGVNFKKGCYTGQEIVARMEYLGKLKQHLYAMHLEGKHTVKVGDKLQRQSGQTVGTVVNVLCTDAHTYLLAVVKDSAVVDEDVWWGPTKLFQD